LKSVLIVSDPLSSGVSVQLNVINFFRSRLEGKFNVFVYWNPISGDKDHIIKKYGLNLIGSDMEIGISRILPRRFRSNEALLWVFSWFSESLFGVVSEDVSRVVREKNIDIVINVSSTTPCISDIWIVQGTPFYETLKNLSRTNLIATLSLILLSFPIYMLERKLLRKFISRSRKIIANSTYIKTYYEKIGVAVSSVLHTIKDFSDFRCTDSLPSRDYVLSYIGKETEINILIDLASRGVKVVTFGSKIPPGISTESIKSHLIFEGYVEEDRLAKLYSNALFTAFPFTEEPFGYIPIESSLCGTPVLTYRKQGPLETIIESKNGWLVDGQDEFIAKATEIWNRKSTGISSNSCVETAQNLVRKFSEEFDSMIEGFTCREQNKV